MKCEMNAIAILSLFLHKAKQQKRAQTQTSIVIIAQMCNMGRKIIYNFQRINSTATVFIISKRKEENKTNNFCYPYSIQMVVFFSVS